MELELGLALPRTPIKGFDLNCNFYEPKELGGLDLLLNHGPYLSSQGTNVKQRKRSFGEAFELDKIVPALPLLVWNNPPNEEDDDPIDLQNKSTESSLTIKKNDGVVGWPPIKAWRKKLFDYQNQAGRPINLMAENGEGRGGRRESSSSKYVKVKMEGVGIARKIDLSRHHSYQTLTDTLLCMFEKCQDDLKDYKLTYQDREGDWLLAGDLPWRSFIQSVQRLRLMRSSR